MKGSSSALPLLGLLLVACLLGRCSNAIEAADVNATVKSIPVANSSSIKKSPPDSMKTNDDESIHNQEKRSQEVNKINHEKNEAKESLTERKDKPSEEPKSKGTNEKNSNGASDSRKVPIDDTLVEGCDPFNRCIDEKNNFIACLRVPGKDSLDLSLLIQNRGERFLNINIMSPDLVKLEKSAVSLKGKENKEVKVSVSDGTNDTMIILKAGDGNCSLTFLNMVPIAVRRSESSRVAGYLSSPIHTSSLGLLLSAGLLILAAWLCIKFCRAHRQGAPRCEKVEMLLPVSTGGSKESEEADGWDNSWADGWDDEETPKTPLKHVSTPSSKGLASRRLIKDGWKD